MSYSVHDPQDVDLSADVHDLEFEGSKLNLLPDADMRSFTGIDPAGRAPGGSEIVLFNTHDTYSIVLPHDDAGSTDGNRFLTNTGEDFVLGPHQLVWAVRNENENAPTAWVLEPITLVTAAVHFGAGGGHGTSGTRWFYQGNSDSAASTSIKWAHCPVDVFSVEMRYANRAFGTGTGDFTVTLCTINPADDTVTATAIEVTVDADSTRTASDSGDVIIAKGAMIGVRTVANGTISASPASPIVMLTLNP